MISWLGVKQTKRGFRLRVRGYMPPFRARVFFMALALITLLTGMILGFVMLGNDSEWGPVLEKAGIPGWLYYVLCVVPLLLPAVFLCTPIGQWIGEKLIGSCVTIHVTKDYVQIVRWFVYRRKFPAGPGLTFERHPHPKAREEMMWNEFRIASNPRYPAKALRFDQYQKSQIVVLRLGLHAIRLASIYDRKPAGLGHKADRLVSALQRLYAEVQTGNRSTDPTKTPLQYGQRPQVA